MFIAEQQPLIFIPHPEAKYDFDYVKIIDELNNLSVTDDKRFIQFARFWCQESLFFLLYFVLRIPVNHPFLVERVKEVQAENDKTLDLWGREHFKALSVDTKVWTSNGWKCHGDLQPGDEVFGADGQLVNVVANTGPMFGAKCYKVSFDDGVLIAGADHLWPMEYQIRPRIDGSEERDVHWVRRLTRTDELPIKQVRSRMPRTPVLAPGKEFSFLPMLPIDPYVLGVWLGDGTAESSTITSADTEIVDNIRFAGYNIKETSTYLRYNILGFRDALRKQGLLNNKYIPYRYLTAAPSQRLALLQGLMDTDGTCNDRGTAYFVNTNHSIATGVYHLAASLGMKPHLNMFDSQNTGIHKPTYNVTFQAYDNLPPFRLTRKLERCKLGVPLNAGRYVQNVEEIESVPINCIQVDSADGIYLAGLELIPTHNSTIITYGLNIQHILKDPNVRIGIFSHTRGIAKAFLRRIKVTLEENKFLKQIFPDILYDNPSSQSPKWSEDEGIVVKRDTVFQEATVEAWGLVDGQPTSKHYSVLNYDDVVTEKSVSTPDQLAKIDTCFKLSLNLGTADGIIRIIGTTYHFADQYEKMKEEGGWKVRIHESERPDGRPVLLSEERLAFLRRKLGPYVYSCQHLLTPIAKKDQKFRPEWLQYYRILPKNLLLILICDPANTKKVKRSGSDYTVFWLWGIDSRGNKFLVDAVRDRLTLTERWTTLKGFIQRYPNIHRIGYEQYGMTSDIAYFREMMEVESFFFREPDELSGNQLSKEDRITRLIPAFENKLVWLPEHLIFVDKEDNEIDIVKVFVDTEYLRFPFSQHDDLLDAASRIEDEVYSGIRPFDDAEDSEIGEELGFVGRLLSNRTADPIGRDVNTGY